MISMLRKSMALTTMVYRFSWFAIVLFTAHLAVVTAQQNSPLLSALVPKIVQHNYELIPEGNQYSLKVSDEEGASTRMEVVELRPADTPKGQSELHVSGEYFVAFPNSQLVLEVFYEAGKHGHVAKYHIFMPMSPVGFLSPTALKSAVG